MRVLIQRVSHASVTVNQKIIGEIGPGLLVLAGIGAGDSAADCEWLAKKIVGLRVFDDEAGVMNKSVIDTCGAVLAISQFTLFASTAKGNRPSYSAAAKAEISKPLFDAFLSRLSIELGQPVATGEFGADMKVALINDGPITIWIDSKERQ
jgi:D-aminoacyl-tRNA deacylase